MRYNRYRAKRSYGRRRTYMAMRGVRIGARPPSLRRKARPAWRRVMLRRVAATSKARRRLVYPG